MKINENQSFLGSAEPRVLGHVPGCAGVKDGFPSPHYLARLIYLIFNMYAMVQHARRQEGRRILQGVARFSFVWLIFALVCSVQFVLQDSALF